MIVRNVTRLRVHETADEVDVADVDHHGFLRLAADVRVGPGDVLVSEVRGREPEFESLRTVIAAGDVEVRRDEVITDVYASTFGDRLVRAAGDAIGEAAASPKRASTARRRGPALRPVPRQRCTLRPGGPEGLLETISRATGLVAATGALRCRSDGRLWPPGRLAHLACGPMPPRPLFPSLEDEDWHAAVALGAAGPMSCSDVVVVDYDDHEVP